jgi:hypothetical protein
VGKIEIGNAEDWTRRGRVCWPTTGIYAVVAQVIENEEEPSEVAEMLCIEQRSARWGNHMPDSMSRPLRNSKGKIGQWEATGRCRLAGRWDSFRGGAGDGKGIGDLSETMRRAPPPLPTLL